MTYRTSRAYMAVVALSLPATLFADVTGSPTLSVNQFLNLDTGAVGTSGDFQWTGTSIIVQSGAGWYPFAIAGFGGGLSAYNAITQGNLAALPAYTPGGGAGGTIPLQEFSAAGSIIAFKTRGGNYAKVLINSSSQGGSLGLQFTTYGAAGGGTGPNAPSITAVQNNYGQIPQGLPNYGLAPGTIFFIKGSNLASTTTDLLSSAAPGLQTTVSGVTVTATVGSTTVQCPIYYLSPTQIDAILPETVPVGNGTITVANNGSTSSGAQITVVQSAFGVLSYNGTLGALYDGGNNLITSTNAANPNQTLVLWGSGVGADPGNDDKVYPQNQNNLVNIPMHAYVGGVEATILYRGRSQFPGLDQVVLQLPGSLPTGCYVSVAIVSGNIVSNIVTIPVAASGRTCSDSTTIPPDVISSLSGKTTINEGVLLVTQATDISSQGTESLNSVGGFFDRVSGFGSSGSVSQTSIGSCVVYNTIGTGGSTGGSSVGLDAGASISLTGPAGSLSLSPLALLGAGFYTTSDGTVPAGFIPAGGGAFIFDNGGGGKDVGHFNVTLNAPPTLVWQNVAQISSVTRTQGVTVTWTGGAAGSYVSISGSSSVTANGSLILVTFTCQAPQSAGQFTVPVPVLLSLPAGSGELDVTDYTTFQTFTAPGLDFGFALAGSETSKELSYN